MWEAGLSDGLRVSDARLVLVAALAYWHACGHPNALVARYPALEALLNSERKAAHWARCLERYLSRHVGLLSGARADVPEANRLGAG